MTTTYVLIDYENVQPKDVGRLSSHALHVIVFVGASQNKISTELAEAMQVRGESARYVRITGDGKNALDFHIALYLGELSAQDPDGNFYVLSKDKGFDPLIRHVRARGVKAQRLADLAKLPKTPSCSHGTLKQQVELVISNLKKGDAARPQKRKKLERWTNALFQNVLTESQVRQITDALERQGVIAIKDEAITYAF